MFGTPLSESPTSQSQDAEYAFAELDDTYGEVSGHDDDVEESR